MKSWQWMAVLSMSAAMGAEVDWTLVEGQNQPMDKMEFISSMADLFPFAYYPSINRMEVAIRLSADKYEDKAKGGFPKEVRVVIKNVESGEKAGEGRVPLDEIGEGQALFDVPDFPDGEYSVEYLIWDDVVVSPQTFKRIHFPFEKTSYGVTHEVFPPFTPVEVKGKDVSVVGRTYTVNGQGLLDKVVTLGRDVLARPMRLVMQDGAGKAVAWKDVKVEGKKLHDDEARFETRAEGGDAAVTSSVVVQEDGAVRVRLTLAPKDGKKAVEVASLKLEIAFKDSEVPLFHHVADNAMRYNYGGYLPRLKKGEKAEWYQEPWDGWWIPARLRILTNQVGVTEDTPVWDSNRVVTHGDSWGADHRDVVPYLWFGAEERGLAVFWESEAGCELEISPEAHPNRIQYSTPVQRVYRKGDMVILEVDLFQRPTTLKQPRTFEFGFMASPTKPMEPDFRTRRIAPGIGPVACWGGWGCPSKYPAEYDWTVVDRIQDIRTNRNELTEEDKAFFAAKAAALEEKWGDRQCWDAYPWLQATLDFAKWAASDFNQNWRGSATYFEEHATDMKDPEWAVFQDEWSNEEFFRFKPERPSYTIVFGVSMRSYQNFALYMANEWMKRGVSLYFDNTMPKRSYSERFGNAWRDPRNGRIVYGTTLWGHREYLRRIYKLRCEWNRRGVVSPIDLTFHMTNTQTLPMNTWATATLDFEQRYYMGDPEKDPPEISLPEDDGRPKEGFQYPWPADYLRAVTFGRQIGARPWALDLVAGYGRHDGRYFTPEIGLREWGMRRVHDIEKGGMDDKSPIRSVAYDKIHNDFGYGDLAKVRHHNYWADKPFMKVDNPDVKWLALEVITPAAGEAKGMVLLQSYVLKQGLKAKVSIPGAKTLEDTETGAVTKLTDGTGEVTFPVIYGTRMFRWK